MSKGDWQGGDRAVPLHLPEPAQAWEDESRLSHQAVHELKMLTTMLLKSTETLGSLGRVAVDHVSRADSSYGMRTRTRRPMHSRGSPSREPSRAPDRKMRKNAFPSCESVWHPYCTISAPSSCPRRASKSFTSCSCSPTVHGDGGGSGGSPSGHTRWSGGAQGPAEEDSRRDDLCRGDRVGPDDGARARRVPDDDAQGNAAQVPRVARESPLRCARGLATDN